MGRGTIKWFNRQKGFGFIQRENDGDLFLHHTGLNGLEVREGDEVEFEIGAGTKGDCAQNVKLV